MKLTAKQESSICLNCGECCKRYSITIFPEEVEKIAKKLKISKKKFLEEHCELFVKLYPKSTPGILTFSTTFFPKRVGEMLSTSLAYIPPSFFVLPQIALRRKKGICRYLNKDNTCQIYKQRPYPCKLFPFMVVPGYEEQYPFCELFRKTSEDYSKQSKGYGKKLTKYFKEVDKKGINGTWKYLPKRGKLFLNEMLIGGVTLKQLEKMMAITQNEFPDYD
jgi:Fe-S-cluster containining protein